MAVFGEAASAPTMTHLKRELMHAVWDLLLDNEFTQAYEHGIVLKCADGVIRRIYPRIFTYSADYPEKYVIGHYRNELLTISTRVLLTTIRYLANRPCPRCFIQKSQIKDIGSHVDDQRRAHIRVDTGQRQDKVNASRRWIFENGRGVNSQAINDILQEDSYVPTRVSSLALHWT
jgi:Plavaka transposase